MYLVLSIVTVLNSSSPRKLLQFLESKFGKLKTQIKLLKLKETFLKFEELIRGTEFENCRK